MHKENFDRPLYNGGTDREHRYHVLLARVEPKLYLLCRQRQVRGAIRVSNVGRPHMHHVRLPRLQTEQITQLQVHRLLLCG